MIIAFGGLGLLVCIGYWQEHRPWADALDAYHAVPQQINDLPFYGGPDVRKTAEMTRLDEQFMATAVEKCGTPELASRYYSGRAWQAFRLQNLNVSMKRANQAWLLDRKNYSSYWVMAIIQSFRGAPDNEVRSLFKMALELVGDAGEEKSRLTQDYETYLAGQGAEHAEELRQRCERYQAALSLIYGKMNMKSGEKLADSAGPALIGTAGDDRGRAVFPSDEPVQRAAK